MAAKVSSASRRSWVAASISASVGAALVAAAIIWPRATGTDVFVDWAPLKAEWMPRLFVTSILPVLVATAGILWWQRITTVLSWRRYLAAVFAGSWLWTMSLALVGGASSIRRVFNRPSEYLVGAREITSVPEFLSGFIEQIPLDSTNNWPIHIAGHPPGATLFFVLLDRLGISGSFWAGFTVLTLGCTASVAAVLTVKTLGSASMARRTAPFLIVAPYVIWMGVSADAFFTAVAAWGLALLAIASTSSRRSGLIGYGLGAGLLLGLCVYFSYGLVLLGILALTVIYLGGKWSVLPWALGGALGVAAAFTLAGFRWWVAFPVLVTRYYDGIQSSRQYGYWVWANLGAWTFTSGLATWAAFPRAVGEAGFRSKHDGHDGGADRRVVALLGLAAFVSILAATLSGMSKAEIERIWLPFTLWVLILPSLLPQRWHRLLLLTHIVSALAIEYLWKTQW